MDKTDGDPTPRPVNYTRSRRAVLVSVAVPAFNEAEILPELAHQIRTVLENEGCDFELIVADNGSSDNSLDVLNQLSHDDPRVRVVALSRNFRHQGGLIAALEHAKGDVVICMDADLQHPPASLPALLDRWEEGYDVVNTRKQSKANVLLFRRLLDKTYYWLVSQISGIPLQDRQSDFRLMDREALDALLALPEHNKYLRGLSYWIGFVHTTIPYELGERYAGRSRYMVTDLIRFAADGLVSFSTLPLRIFTYVGILLSFSSLMYGAYILLSRLLDNNVDYPEGWASLAIGIYFIGGVQLIGIGILGEYLGRNYDETRGRPAYILRRQAKHAVPDSNSKKTS